MRHMRRVDVADPLAPDLYRFNVVQMAVGVRKRAAEKLPAIDEFVNRIRADGTMQKAIAEAGLRGVRVP